MSDTLVDAPSVPSAPAGGDTPAPAAPPVAGVPAAPAVAATPQTAPHPPATGGAPGEGLVPSFRLRETREAAMREAQNLIAQRDAEWQQRYDGLQRQLHALVGVTPPENPEVSTIRQQFGQVYPGLSRLEEKAEDLLGVLEKIPDFDQHQKVQWQLYGQQNMDKLYGLASQTYGAELSNEARANLKQAFIGFLMSSPELERRYETDPTIVDDFWKVFSSSFVDPIRRTATAGAVQRAAGVPLPQDTPGGAPRATPAPKLSSLDERAAAGWTTYNQFSKS